MKETIENNDQGSQDGNPNSNSNTGGGIGTNGIAFNLGGRTVSNLKNLFTKARFKEQ